MKYFKLYTKHQRQISLLISLFYLYLIDPYIYILIIVICRDIILFLVHLLRYSYTWFYNNLKDFLMSFIKFILVEKL